MALNDNTSTLLPIAALTEFAAASWASKVFTSSDAFAGRWTVLADGEKVARSQFCGLAEFLRGFFAFFFDEIQIHIITPQYLLWMFRKTT